MQKVYKVEHRLQIIQLAEANAPHITRNQLHTNNLRSLIAAYQFRDLPRILTFVQYVKRRKQIQMYSRLFRTL